jgi:hypothetical protein
MFLRGQGSFMTYRLIGVHLGTPNVEGAAPIQNGVNSNNSLIMHRMPIPPIVSTTSENLKQESAPKTDTTVKIKKSRACSVM